MKAPKARFLAQFPYFCVACGAQMIAVAPRGEGHRPVALSREPWKSPPGDGEVIHAGICCECSPARPSYQTDAGIEFKSHRGGGVTVYDPGGERLATITPRRDGPGFDLHMDVSQVPPPVTFPLGSGWKKAMKKCKLIIWGWRRAAHVFRHLGSQRLLKAAMIYGRPDGTPEDHAKRDAMIEAARLIRSLEL